MEKSLTTDGVLILKLESKEHLEVIFKYVQLVNEIFNSNPENPTKEETWHAGRGLSGPRPPGSARQ